jgi:fructose-bisphosphate aldolase class II
MPLISMRQLPDQAAEFDYGVPAFNVNYLEQIQSKCRPPMRRRAW